MGDFEIKSFQELSLELEKLKEKLEESYKKSDALNAEKDSLYDELDRISYSDRSNLRIRELEDKLMDIREKAILLYDEQDELLGQKRKLERFLFLAMPPAGSNGVVDLRTEDEQRYYIYLHGENVAVGSIDYRGYHVSDFFGDVGGFVEEEYRGHGYLYEALSVLCDILNKREISDFWVSTYVDNIPSRKSIEKCGGELLDGNDLYRGVLLYQCATEKKKSNIIK